MILEKWIAIGIWSLAFIVMFLFWTRNEKDLIRGFKGINGEWESEEVVPLVWFLLTPVIFFCVQVLELPLSSSAWAAYDTIGLIAFGAKAYLNTHEKK